MVADAHHPTTRRAASFGVSGPVVVGEGVQDISSRLILVSHNIPRASFEICCQSFQGSPMALPRIGHSLRQALRGELHVWSILRKEVDPSGDFSVHRGLVGLQERFVILIHLLIDPGSSHSGFTFVGQHCFHNDLCMAGICFVMDTVLSPLDTSIENSHVLVVLGLWSKSATNLDLKFLYQLLLQQI